MSMKTSRVSLDEVRSIPAPEGTATWRPLQHGVFMDEVHKQIAGIGLDILDESYSVNPSGTEVFGVLYLAHWQGGIQWAVGVRNSNSKLFAAGVCAGLQVLVCDNLMFEGQFRYVRKHTSKLTLGAVSRLVGAAVSALPDRVSGLMDWVSGLARTPISVQQAESLVLQSAVQGALRLSCVPDVWKRGLAAEEDAIRREFPDAPLDPYNLYQVYQAITRTWREDGLLMVKDRSARLARVVGTEQERLRILGEGAVPETAPETAQVQLPLWPLPGEWTLPEEDDGRAGL